MSYDMLAWATGTHVGAGDHATTLFCIGCGRVLGFLYSDTFTWYFDVELRTFMNVLLYMWLWCCAFCNSFMWILFSRIVFRVLLWEPRTILRGGGKPPATSYHIWLDTHCKHVSFLFKAFLIKKHLGLSLWRRQSEKKIPRHVKEFGGSNTQQWMANAIASLHRVKPCIAQSTSLIVHPKQSTINDNIQSI